MMNKKYDIIYSLGFNCGCARHMQRCFLRNYSGPFDWLYGGDFETRAQLICKNFDGFMDKNNFVQLDDVFEQFDRYYNTHTKLGFIHDFPHDTPFDVSFEQIKEKYERRIARFYKLIQESNDVLLIWFSYGVKQTQDEKVVQLCDDICKKLNKKVSFLIIEEDKTIENKKFVAKKLQDNVMRYSFNITKEVITPLGDTEVTKIFNLYSTKKSRKRQIKFRFYRILINILCLFIPISRYRKKVRNKMFSSISFYAPHHN